VVHLKDPLFEPKKGVSMRDSLLMTLVLAAAVFAQADLCKDETQRAENFYELCVKFDMQSPSYTECVKEFMEQKAKASEACKAAPLAPAPAPAAAEPALPAPASAIAPAAAPVAAAAPFFASSAISPACMSEFTGLATSDFDMLGFVKKLPVEVVKVKAQLKLPFGKPADSKKTGVSITVGCLKNFPEKPDEIALLLKDVSMEMAMGIVASKAGIARSQIPADINQLKDLALQVGAQPVADALGFLAGGGAAAAGGGEPAEGEGGEKGMRFGIRAGFNIYDFSFGYNDMDRDLGMGKGFGAGLALNVPIISILRLNAGLDFYYRQLFSGKTRYLRGVGESLHEYAVSVPVLLQIGKDFYAAAGAQLDIPVSTGWDSVEGYDYFSNSRYSFDFGLAIGAGYMLESIAIDFKFVYGLTRLFEDFAIDYNMNYADRSSLMQYGAGVSYFF
jgi:hypothetical protein